MSVAVSNMAMVDRGEHVRAHCFVTSVYERRLFELIISNICVNDDNLARNSDDVRNVGILINLND